MWRALSACPLEKVAAAAAAATAIAAAIAPSFALVDPRVIGGAWAPAPAPTLIPVGALSTISDGLVSSGGEDAADLEPDAAWAAAVAPTKPSWGFGHLPTGRGVADHPLSVPWRVLGPDGG